MQTSQITSFDIIFSQFFDCISANKVEIYNEFSLQHELGIWLRSKLPSNYKVQFERNVSFFGLRPENFIKKEIDIVVFSSDKEQRFALELKFPRNGQHPEQMFSFCKDIVFLEQLCQAGFHICYFVLVADDPLFYQGDSSKGIYQFFRGRSRLKGTVEKPTGKRDERITILKEYSIKWISVKGSMKYVTVQVNL